MGQEDDPEATTIDLASSEEEEVVVVVAAVVMMIRRHHTITILRPKRLQHVQNRERLMHQLKRGGDQASGLEH